VALHTLGSTSTTALNAIQFYPSGTTSSSTADTLSPADLAAINQSISGDGRFAVSNPTGILLTASTHSNTTLDTFSATGGGPLSSIQVGQLVLGVGIVPGTFVTARTPTTGTPTSVTLSQAASATATGVYIGIIPLHPTSDTLSFMGGRLYLPGGRGVIFVHPGDYVAIDNTGWPIVVSQASVAYAGSLWHLV
jgi:hypothetical protein